MCVPIAGEPSDQDSGCVHIQDEDVDGPPSDVVDKVSECMNELVHEEPHVDGIQNVHASMCPRDVCEDDEWLVEPHADVDAKFDRAWQMPPTHPTTYNIPRPYPNLMQQYPKKNILMLMGSPVVRPEQEKAPNSQAHPAHPPKTKSARICKH